MNQNDYAPSPCLPMIKKCAHFLFLANIPTNLWTLIIGNLFYLSNWRMRYSRMTWHLLVLAKYLGFFYKAKIQIACSLNDIQIPTKAIYVHTWQKPSIYASYFVLSLVKFCDLIEKCFMLPRSKLTHTPQKTAIPTLRIR
jgi:hypothetical protein